MQKTSYSNSIKISFIFIFIVVILFGLNLSANIDNGGHMMRCPFQENGSGLCPMNIVDHIMKWNDCLSAIMVTGIEALGLAIMFMLIQILIRSIFIASPPQLFYKNYVKEKPESKFFSFFISFFSQGILHPKLFS